MAKKVIELPFLLGQDESADPKVTQYLRGNAVPLRRAINVRMRRDGRLTPRKDYDQLALTSYGGTLEIFDLVNLDGRLIGFGDTSLRSFPTDVFEYIAASGTAFAWRGTEGGDTDIRIGPANAFRDIGRLPATGVSVTTHDVAAANGFVCSVTFDGVASIVHVFKASTGQTLLLERSTTILFRPRVTAISNVFYIAGLTAAGTAIDLRSFDPATNSATQTVSTPYAAGAAIVAWDMTNNSSNSELIMAAARVTPTTSILRVNTAGVTQQTIAGPATLLDFCSVRNDNTNITFVQVNDATRIVRISTYAVSGGALVAGPTTLFASGTTLQQASVNRRDATQVRVMAQIDNSPTVDVRYQDVNTTTHALSAVTSWGTSFLTTKERGQVMSASVTEAFFGGRFPDDDCTSFLGLAGSEQVLASKEHYVSCETLDQLGHIALDSATALCYWPQIIQDVDALGVPLVTEFAIIPDGRVQTASIGGHLYIASGQPLVYDGKQLVESGFADVPVIFSTTGSNGAGTLTPLGLYTVAVTWEWIDAQGALHQSAPSVVSQVTLGAADDTITVVASSPHSARRNATNETFGSAVKVVAWCSEANGTVLQRAVFALATTTTYGNTVSLVILGPDTTLAQQAVLYTQGARGALSGPLPFECPLPAKYIWASKERVIVGGLPNAAQIQESRPLFPNEPIEWSLGLGFFSTVRGDITAVAILDEQRYVFTREEIFVVPGDGIDDNGNGTLGPPIKLPSDGGCIDWRSLCECSLGLFFQLDTDKLYILPRGGGAPGWIGKAVQDTLTTYPFITSATLVASDQTVCFTCNDSADQNGLGVIIVYDLRAQTWFVDEPLLADATRASCSYQGRLVIATDGGLVFYQRTSDTPNTFIPTTLETVDIYGTGPDGWSQIYGAAFLGEFRGNCILSCDYSLDGGLTFITTGRDYSLTGLTVGARVRRTWTFGPFPAESIRLRFTTTALAAAATAGLVSNSFGLLVEPVEGLARVPSDAQG